MNATIAVASLARPTCAGPPDASRQCSPPLVLLVVVLSAGGPGSVVGIDIAHTSNPDANLGVAQSMVNLGGFLATLLVLATMCAVLTAPGGFTPEAFRIAWLVQYPVWAFAVVGVFITRRKARRVEAARGRVPRPAIAGDQATGDLGYAAAGRGGQNSSRARPSGSVKASPWP